MNQLITIVAQYGMALGGLGYIALVCVTPSRARRSRMVGSALVGLMCLGVLGALAGVLWNHPRPYADGGPAALFAAAPANGFPSWPVAVAAIFAMLLFWRHRTYGFAAAGIAIVVAVTRYRAGVETFADSAVGFALGVAAGFLGILIFGVIWHRLYLAAAAKLAEEAESHSEPTANSPEISGSATNA